MANGDLASTLGWTTFASTQDRKQGYDNDNYALDRAAEQFVTLRDKVLPSIDQPVHAVRRASGSITVANQKWTPLPSNCWRAPDFTKGFTRWASGQLTVMTAGLYRLQAHVQFGATSNRAAIQIVRNTTAADTTNTLVRNSSDGRGITAGDLVRLVAGDVLMVLAYSDGRADDIEIADDAYNLTFSAEWVRP